MKVMLFSLLFSVYRLYRSTVRVVKNKMLRGYAIGGNFELSIQFFDDIYVESGIENRISFAIPIDYGRLRLVWVLLQ